MFKAFGIFEGGGAKGLAHIGALQAAEEYDVNFIGVAGSSAGAIIAALVAVGYSAKDLFDPFKKKQKGIFDEDFIILLGKNRWCFFSNFRKLLKLYKNNLFARIIFIAAFIALFIGAFFAIIRALAFLLSWSWFYTLVGILLFLFIIFVFFYLGNMLMPLGIFSTEGFENWLNKKLAQKLFPGEEGKRITFNEVECPLKIIATDIRSRKIIIFSKETSPDYSVAKAVRCSISIPVAFPPHIENNMVLVDGGVLSNFPAWVFDQQRREQKEIVSTIGFRLHQINPATANENRQISISSYLFDLSTVFFGDNLLQIREIEDLHLIPIEVSADTLDFDMSEKEKRNLYNDGFVAATKFFRSFTGPKNTDEINFLLTSLHRELSLLINKTHPPHLRINIALPIEPLKQQLRILYSFNMDKDTDDKLKLSINSGAIGKCWSTGRTVLVDMEEAKQTFETVWKMSKYEQALVRPTLKTLISLPIFNDYLDKVTDKDKSTILAILSIDSDDNLLSNFSELSINSDSAICIKSFRKRIAKALRT